MLLRLTAHRWVFCRVTGPGASDAGVTSERVTALEMEKETPPAGLGKLQRANVPAALRGTQLCSHLTLWSCQRASVKSQTNCRPGHRVYFGTGCLRDGKSLLEISFVTDANTVIYRCEYFFHF